MNRRVSLVSALVAVAVLVSLAGCPGGRSRPGEGTRCEAGQTWHDPDSTEVMVCDDGRWRLYRNPNPNGGS